jgi:NAD(P)-dependent dehydrogenase (short-subunit alcohol dehydrogenase family)
MLLKDKVALVTGGGEGIGRATCLRMAEAGARVVVADIRKSVAEETVALIEAQGGEAFAVEVDVSNAEQVAAMVAEAVSRYGRLDCACNNAAGGARSALLPDIKESDWDLCIDVTLKGVWLCLKNEIPAMLANGGGTIVNIASMSGEQGEAGLGAYSAAKGGVLALTKTAAAEYAQKNIRVNAINPGAIRTAGLQKYFDMVEGAEEKTAGTHAMRRVGEPSEIADAVVYLCSAQSSFVTGHALNVEGGVAVNPHTM